MKNSFENKVVWITGASSGFGEELAYALVGYGAKVILSSRRVDILLELKKKLGKGKAEVLELDLVENSLFQAKVEEAISVFGYIDIIIHNAGLGQNALAMEAETSTEKLIMQVDYFSYTELTKCLLPHFIDRKSGQIVVVSGLMAYLNMPGRSTYAAAKAALVAYFGCMRAEIAQHKIDITVLIPGAMQTDLVNKAIIADGSVIKDGKKEIKGASIQMAAEQALKAVSAKKYQCYIGNRDKSFYIWKLFGLYPNFVIKRLLKMFGKA